MLTRQRDGDTRHIWLKVRRDPQEVQFEPQRTTRTKSSTRETWWTFASWITVKRDRQGKRNASSNAQRTKKTRAAIK